MYYCKGSRLNVLPSGMIRQMTLGMSTYETTAGKPARKEDLVNIFDYEDQGLVSDPQRQDISEGMVLISQTLRTNLITLNG